MDPQELVIAFWFRLLQILEQDLKIGNIMRTHST